MKKRDRAVTSSRRAVYRGGLLLATAGALLAAAIMVVISQVSGARHVIPAGDSGIDGFGRSLGAADAPVVMIEYADFQ